MTITPTPHVAVIVVAAGSGTRLGGAAPKALVGIDEHSVLWHALVPLAKLDAVQIVVVAPPGREGDALTEARSAAPQAILEVVTGAQTRQESVAAGLDALWPDIDIVLVHDAARALTPVDVFERVIDAVQRTGHGIIPVLPVVDTVKQVDGDEVIVALDRSALAAAQTPQGFRRDVLEAAYRARAQEFTDDAALVAAAGHQVFVVDGSELGWKITTPADLDRARALVAGSPAPSATPAPVAAQSRVGVGTDVHRFSEGGVLWLAGLEWPGESALTGHSDGDAVSHAIVDALLSAAGLGDIGEHFGTADPEYAGAHADVFLARTRALLSEAGWSIGNVAVQVQAARPRFSPRRAEAEAVLSKALGGAAVSVSATTTDGLGFVGRGEGVAAVATALVTR